MAKSLSMISGEINRAQRQLNAAQKEKDMYKESLGYSNSLISNLKRCSTSLSEANDNLKRYFTINNKTADGGSVENASENINQIIKDLEKNIVPHIISQINTLTREISSLKSQISGLKREIESSTNLK